MLLSGTTSNPLEDIMRMFVSLAAMAAVCITLVIADPAPARNEPGEPRIPDPTAGGLRGSTGICLSSAVDRRLRVLNRRQIEQYKCRLESGFVGLGLSYKPLKLLNQGLLIKTVGDGTTASDAGLTEGSVIVAVDGNNMQGMRWEKAEALFAGEEGSLMKLTLLKDEQKTEVIIKRNPGKTLGLAVELFKPTCLFEIDWVSWQGPAQKAGIEKGDIVTHINGIDVEGGSSSWMMNQSGAESPLGAKVSLTLQRQGKSFTAQMKRSIVEMWGQSVGFASQNYDGPDGRGITHLTLKNLDWLRVVKWVDDNLESMNNHGGCVLDLRGASGDNPELAARIAARFIHRGQVLACTKREGNNRTIIRYSVGATVDDEAMLLTISGSQQRPKVQLIERPIKQLLDPKLVVLVDNKTSGTAEALALALQERGRATVVGGTTAGVNQLVTTNVFTVGDDEIYVQAPTITLTWPENEPTPSVRPDRNVWWGDPLDTARDELAGRYWYNDPGYLCVGVLIAIMALVIGITSWVSRRNRFARTDAGAPLMVLTLPPEPVTTRQFLIRLAFVVAGLLALLGVGLINKYSTETPPEGAKAELIAELHLDPETHQQHEQLFRQLSKEIDGPVTFVVVPDAEAKTWIHPGLTVKYQWVDKHGKHISSGGMRTGAENKVEMVKAIQSAQTSLQRQFPQATLPPIRWHRQTPVLVNDTKPNDR